MLESTSLPFRQLTIESDEPARVAAQGFRIPPRLLDFMLEALAM